jgi:hypothetical protein
MLRHLAYSMAGLCSPPTAGHGTGGYQRMWIFNKGLKPVSGINLHQQKLIS